MTWTHDDLMELVPYEQPDVFDPLAPRVGIAVIRLRDGDQTDTPSDPELMAAYGGIAAQARRLVFAAPIMYQCLATGATAMQSAIEKLESLQAQCAVPEGLIEAIVEACEEVERGQLTAMQVATDGLEQVARGRS